MLFVSLLDRTREKKAAAAIVLLLDFCIVNVLKSVPVLSSNQQKTGHKDPRLPCYHMLCENNHVAIKIQIMLKNNRQKHKMYLGNVGLFFASLFEYKKRYSF